MIRVFADTSYFIALLNERDELHRVAVNWAMNRQALVTTSEYVFIELLDTMAHPLVRQTAIDFIRDIIDDPLLEVVPAESDLTWSGIDLFESRADKEWSLTDCISFLIMQEKGILDALSGDHHFEQAGFVAHLVEH